MDATQDVHHRENAVSPDYDVVVVGAGFAGLYSLYRLREMGLSVKVIEKADDVGGTWYHNRYPGCRCDTESHVYCYSFSEELLDDWEYSERYPQQEEILEYFRHVADRFDLRKDIEFETEVQSATFDEDAGYWRVQTDTDAGVSTRHLILAVGPLSDPFVPDFDGIDSFEGETYHTATWPHEPVDFEGKSVGIIGTGSTGAQAIPRIAERADQLSVYQRTPNFIIPARNHPLTEEDYEEIRENYDEIWETAWSTQSGHPFEYTHQSVEGLSEEEVREALEEGWEKGGFRFFHTFGDLLSNWETNDTVAEFISEKIRERLDDPELAEKLIPDDHPYGAKRPPLDYEGYYETYQKDHVNLIDVNEAPIEEITPRGIRTSESEYEHDTIIFATGFDAITGGFTKLHITGRNGTTLTEKWDDGPRSYLGFSVDEFPNLHMISGPQSPAAITNQPVSIERQVQFISGIIEHMRDRGYEYIEAKEEDVDEWVHHTNEVAEGTLYTEASSWYKGDNIPGKPETMLMYAGGFDNHSKKCDEVAANGYEGYRFGTSVEALEDLEAEL
jgi:cyclohexanone monooxygenase